MSSRFIRQALVLLSLAFLPGIGQALYLRDRVSWRAPVAASEEMTVGEALRFGNQIYWVDARPDEQFQADHIPGAVQLNEDRWNQLLPEMLASWAPDKRVIVYCSSQSCGTSREVARRLRTEAGLKNVFVLDGGWEAWLEGKK